MTSPPPAPPPPPPLRDEKEIGSIARIQLEPGDVIVMSCPEATSVKVFTQLHERLNREFPGHRVLILDCGVSFGVVSPDKAIWATQRTELS